MSKGAQHGQRGFLARLRADTGGNTLAIMAASLIPLCAFAGSAMDMARLYVVKVRLQQACDAGALASRKFMPTGVAPVPDGAAPNIVNKSVASTNTTPDLNGRTLAASGTQALNYFNNNLETSWGGLGWYTAATDKFDAKTVADAQGNTQVQGNAQADVPMTLMQMFGFSSQTVKVQCQASFSTPDTDVMFVLDTTGSMGCSLSRGVSDCDNYVVNNTVSDGAGGYKVTEEMSGGTNISRIDSLRQAVNAFYDTVSKHKDSSTNVRYGFVPYSATVNVGTLLYGLSASNLVSSWSYQSRVATSDQVLSSSAARTVAAANQAACLSNYVRTPASRAANAAGDARAGYPNSGTATAIDPVWTASTSKCTVTTDTVGPVWTYQGGVQYDVSRYVQGGSMPDPSKVDGSTTTWNGCIEERDTVAGATSFSSGLPPDLDPDLAATTTGTRWRPMWPSVEYARQYYNLGYNDPALAPYQFMSCPAQAKPLFLPVSNAAGAATISNYVNGLKPLGYTYHDIGMIWGTRLLSPTGLWASNNGWPTGRAEPKRIIVFVTDGTMEPSSNAYGAYGVELFDRRVTGTTFGGGDPSSSSNSAAYTTFHNNRFLAECAKAKSSPLNFDVWVVEVAGASSTELTQCASRPSQVLVGKDAPSLQLAFQQIAAQVAMLRVSN